MLIDLFVVLTVAAAATLVVAGFFHFLKKVRK